MSMTLSRMPFVKSFNIGLRRSDVPESGSVKLAQEPGDMRGIDWNSRGELNIHTYENGVPTGILVAYLY